jgi:hypothetical protein
MNTGTGTFKYDMLVKAFKDYKFKIKKLEKTTQPINIETSKETISFTETDIRRFYNLERGYG